MGGTTTTTDDTRRRRAAPSATPTTAPKECQSDFVCIPKSKGAKTGVCTECPKQCHSIAKGCIVKDGKPGCKTTGKPPKPTKKPVTTTKKPAQPGHNNGPVVKFSIALLASVLMAFF